jgi:hypothetical protein
LGEELSVQGGPLHAAKQINTPAQTLRITINRVDTSTSLILREADALSGFPA